MTEPQFGGREDFAASNPPPTPPPGYQPQQGYPQQGYPQQYPPPPPAGAYYDPAAPYGRQPLTGEPLSDKSKLIAGLLQLIGIIGIVGIGRFYLGHIKLGVIQLVVGIVTFGLGAFIWGIIDAIMIFTDKVRDPQGRPLRDGT